jgi:hypothetical protein
MKHVAIPAMAIAAAANAATSQTACAKRLGGCAGGQWAARFNGEFRKL